MIGKAATCSGRTLPPRQKPTCNRCGGHVRIRRVADFLDYSRIKCGHEETHHSPRTPVFDLGVPPSAAPSHENLFNVTDRDLENASYIDRVRYLQQHLLAMFDAGIEVDAIKRETQHTDTDIELHLHNTLTAASGTQPQKFVVVALDGINGRVSWVDDQGRLWHRPFDGPFPRGYPKEKAIEQYRKVLWTCENIATLVGTVQY